ncbi:chromosomal replication initiator, putative [Babesia ovata]|uniref:Chromosomal replication initiator, putative n=1 Tax=Babesia ovata TaxID=189622 RepID=A0A2H6KBP1_9APIC|nr:chromosomal replication initiator, putative [Babesia ovata]GBE60410.1 chromosomal replication initiator, putative [Babesia ovata]
MRSASMRHPDDNGSPPGRSVVFYATNDDYYRKVKRLNILFKDIEETYRDLMIVLSGVAETKDTPEIKTAVQMERYILVDNLENVRNKAQEYVELGNIFDEYAAITREIQGKDMTPARSAELIEALANIQERFKDKEELAFVTLQLKDVSCYERTLIKARKFVQKLKAQQPTPSQSLDESLSGLNIECPQAFEGDATGDIQLILSVVTKPVMPSDAENEVMRQFHDDQDLLTTVDKIKPETKQRDDVVHGCLMKGSDTETVTTASHLNINLAPEYIQYKNDLYTDDLKMISYVWDIYNRYNAISDTLIKIGPKAPQAAIFVGEQQRLASAFEDYAPLLETIPSEGINGEALSMLSHLRSLKGIIKAASISDNDNISVEYADSSKSNPSAQYAQDNSAASDDTIAPISSTIPCNPTPIVIISSPNTSTYNESTAELKDVVGLGAPQECERVIITCATKPVSSGFVALSTNVMHNVSALCVIGTLISGIHI